MWFKNTQWCTTYQDTNTSLTLYEHLVGQYICLSFVYKHTDVTSVLSKPVVDKLHDDKILLTKNND